MFQIAGQIILMSSDQPWQLGFKFLECQISVVARGGGGGGGGLSCSIFVFPGQTLSMSPWSPVVPPGVPVCHILGTMQSCLISPQPW